MPTFKYSQPVWSVLYSKNEISYSENEKLNLVFIVDIRGKQEGLHAQLFSRMLTRASGLNRVGTGVSDKRMRS